jgi:small subunit ribosomal protein S19
MSRSIWKGPYIHQTLLKIHTNISQTKDINTYLKRSIKIKSRNSIILPTFIGLRVHIYNGKKYLPIKILPEMVGYKFGSFCSTRTFTKKLLKKQIKIKK